MDTENRPVLTGLVALVGVAVVIGLLGGLAVLVGVKAAGIGDTTEATDDPTSSATFRLPEPTETSTETTPEETEPSPGDEASSEAPAEGISLTAAQQSRSSPMQQIDLTGTYPAGRGRHPAGAADRERRVVRLPGDHVGQRRHLRDVRPDQPRRCQQVPRGRHRLGRRCPTR